MKTRSLAYMAGLMDTDGTLGIYDRGDSGYQAVVNFCNDDLKLMKWCVKTFGGYYKPTKDDRRKAIGYLWFAQGKEHKIRFLTMILPYLVLKKQEAQIIIEFDSLDRDDPEKRKELMVECRRLKGTRSIVETEMLEGFLRHKPTTQRAYIAGLMDGDGHICPYEKLVAIGFTNMCGNLIEALMNMYGGGRYKPKPSTWRWQLSGIYKQEIFLLHVLPYLRIKKDRAKKSLNFVRASIAKRKYIDRKKVVPGTRKPMIQPDLTGDRESASVGTLKA